MAETTARMITITLALLALHPQEQDIAVEEIRRVLVNGRDPVLNDLLYHNFLLMIILL